MGRERRLATSAKDRATLSGHYDLENPAAATAPPCLKYGGSLCQTCADFRGRTPNQEKQS